MGFSLGDPVGMEWIVVPYLLHQRFHEKVEEAHAAQGQEGVIGLPGRAGGPWNDHGIIGPPQFENRKDPSRDQSFQHEASVKEFPKKNPQGIPVSLNEFGHWEKH